MLDFKLDPTKGKTKTLYPGKASNHSMIPALLVRGFFFKCFEGMI